MAIFVSYNREDIDYVTKLVEDLEAAGLTVWYDREMRPGDFWPDEIESNILSAQAVLVVLSQQSIQSRHVRGEVEFSERNEKLIVPLVIGNLKEREVPTWILARNYVDGRDDRDPLPELKRAFDGPQSERVAAAAANVRRVKTGVLTEQTSQLVVVPAGGRIAAAGVAINRETAAGVEVAVLSAFPNDDVRYLSRAVRVLVVDDIPQHTVLVSDELATSLGLDRPEQDPWELSLAGVTHYKATEVCLEVTVAGQLEEVVNRLEQRNDLAGRLLRGADESIEIGGDTYRIIGITPPPSGKDDVIEVASDSRIRLFSSGVKSGVDMVILADCSGSMSIEDVTDKADVVPQKRWFGGSARRRTQTRMKALQQALMELLDTRLSLDGRVSRIALVGFTRDCKVRFPRRGESMVEIDSSSPPEVQQDFRDAIGLLRAENAGTDIGQALHFAAELLHRHGRPGNDRLVVLISDGATWTPKGEDATGEVVSGVNDPVSLMDHLHDSMQIHLHAIGISTEDLFFPWWKQKHAEEPHVSMIPNHQLLDQLVAVGGGDPSRSGDTDVLAEYFSGLGSGVTRQVRCGAPRPLPELQGFEKAAIAKARAQSEQYREITETRQRRGALAVEVHELYVRVNEQAERIAEQPLFRHPHPQKMPKLLQTEVHDETSYENFVEIVNSYVLSFPRSMLSAQDRYAAPEIVSFLRSEQVESLYSLKGSGRELSSSEGECPTSKLVRELMGEAAFGKDDVRSWHSMQLAILSYVRGTLAEIVELYSQVSILKDGVPTRGIAATSNTDEESSGFRFIG